MQVSSSLRVSRLSFSTYRIGQHLTSLRFTESTRPATTQHFNPSTYSLAIVSRNSSTRTMTNSNAAAWQTAAKAKPFEVKEAPIYTPESGEILVENRAVAINPVDGSLQAFAWWPMEYPTILGQDIAGEVAAVGPNVTRFKKGDRVVAHAVGMATKRTQDNAFQRYTIVNAHMASELPAAISFEQAAVLPLGLSTAACGLFQEAPFLNLDLPTEPARKPNGKTILIWGGSSSVGSNGIQLAVAAGYEVITTCSPHNFDYVKQLGASKAFDYHSSSIGQDLLNAFKGKTIAGALDCIGGDGAIISVDIIHKIAGKGAVATTKGGCKDPPEGVTIKNIFGTTLKDNKVGKAIYEEFLPKALNAGAFVPAPKQNVVGNGLESVQKAVDGIMKGVSASKLVVVM